MIQLTVIKSSCGGAVKWEAQPESLCLGARDANLTEKMKIVLPEEWQDFTVRITFIPHRQDPVALILPPDGVVDITGNMTCADHGAIVLDAVKGEQVTYSTGVLMYTYRHPDAGGKDPGYTPDEYQQFVAQIEDAASRAEAAAVHGPIIGENGNWQIWNPESGQYEDSGYPASGGGSGGGSYIIGNGLKLEGNILSVNAAGQVEQDNTLPITSAAVYTAVGNIEILLETI